MLNMLNAYRVVVEPLLDFIYPPSCTFCGAVLSDARARLCPTCWSAVLPVSPNDNIYLETFRRLTDEGVFDALIIPDYFVKDAPLQSLIHTLKYSGCPTVGILLGLRCGRVWDEFSKSPRPDVIIPVPLHARKFRERGYNQAEYVARGIAKQVGGAVRTDVLRRTRWTGTQTHLTVEERMRNVAQAFDVPRRRRSWVEGNVVAVVDDVITTGSTMLRLQGASAVIGCAAALAA